MNEITIFKNEKFGEVRTMEINNECWFVGKDIASALGYSNPRDAISKHCDKEDVAKHDTLTNGGKQAISIINESGVYALIFGSKLESAKEFKHWVTSEVLPSIRKHGLFAMNEVLENPDLLINALTELKKEREEKKLIESQKEALQIELDNSKEWYSIKRMEKLNPTQKFNWRLLKKESERLNIEIKKVFDANYGEVNTYNVKVWESLFFDVLNYE